MRNIEKSNLENRGQETVGVFTDNIFDAVDNITHKKKVREDSIYFDLNELLDSDYMYNLISICKVGVRYSILLRVSYIKNENKDLPGDITEWKSLGKQIYLSYNSDDQLYAFVEKLQSIIVERLKLCIDLYDFSYEGVDSIQMLIYDIRYNEIVKKKIKFDVDSLDYHKDLIEVGKISKMFNSVSLSKNKSDFGVKLRKNISNNMIEHVILTNGNELDIIGLIGTKSNTNNITVKDPGNIDFYQRPGFKDDNIVVVQRLDKNVSKIGLYNLDGTFLYGMDDTINEDDNLVRKVGNVTAYTNETEVFNKEVELHLDYIKPSKLTKTLSEMNLPDWRFGTMDLETFKYSDDISKPYAAGFHVDRVSHTFYVNDNLDYDLVIIECIDNMLKQKYNNFIFYVHNLGEFDAIFILRVIIKYNRNNNNVFGCDPIFRDNSIISLTISKVVNNKKLSIKLVDSYNLLTSSLDKLCNTFETETKKTSFPYEFVKESTLFYKGNTPDINYFHKKDSNGKRVVISNSEYLDIYSHQWDTKEVTVDYLKNDLVCLYNVIEEFQNRIFRRYYVQITGSLTISSLSMEIYLRKFYNDNIPLINKKSIYNDLKKGYFGGITEVYKPYGKNLYYYDVNSLYPYSALNPMPGVNCVYIENIDKNIDQLDQIEYNELFGFYKCKVRTNNNSYFGLLPVRSVEGLTMPLGEFEGWYFSEEIKYAYSNGYQIELQSGYKFDKAYSVFNDYINEFYKIKKEVKDPVMRSIAKSLLNNLLGRFGLNIEKDTTELVDYDRFSELLQSREVKNIKHIEDMILVTYSNHVSYDICNSHHVDYKSAYMNKKRSNTVKDILRESDPNTVSIAISSAVTAYSRIHMNKIKSDILSRGGSIYYTDTDSIVTDLELDGDMVGLDIGQLKLVEKIREGYFISNKTYAYKGSKNETLLVTKGASSSYMSYSDFERLYSGREVKVAKLGSIKDYSSGSVTVNVPTPIILSANSYTKRHKLYKNNRWIDTRPLIYPRDFTRSYHSRNNLVRLVIEDRNKRDFVLRFISGIRDILILLLFIIAIILYTISQHDSDDMNTIGGYEDDMIIDGDQGVDPYTCIKDTFYYNNTNIFYNILSNYFYMICGRYTDKVIHSNFVETPNADLYESVSPDSSTEEANKDGKTVKYSDVLFNLKELYLEQALTKIDEQNILISRYKTDLLSQRINVLDSVGMLSGVLDNMKEHTTALTDSIRRLPPLSPRLP